jgi:hypothetical protein
MAIIGISICFKLSGGGGGGLSKELFLKFCKKIPHFYGVANPFLSHCYKINWHTTTYYWMFYANVLCLFLSNVVIKNSKLLQKRLTTFG